MKKLIVSAILCTIVVSSFGKATLCPKGQKSGSGCYEVAEVLFLGHWSEACCFNVTPPEGYNCVSDNCLARMAPDQSTSNAAPVKNLEFAKQNAYVLFSQYGYRTWTIVDGEVNRNVPGNDFNTETMRKYLPFAQALFEMNPELKMFRFKHSQGVEIVIQRPENEEDLAKQIIIPDLEQDKKDFEIRMRKRIEESLVISPNPASDFIKVYFEYTLSISKMEITTVNGLTVQSMLFPEAVAEAEMPIESLPPGPYILKITDHLGFEVSKQFLKK